VSAQAQQQRRSFVDRLVGLAVALGVFAKFFAFFVSFAAYSLWFHSWRFGLGLVLLILVHELGHVAEARRQGLPVTLPTFIPFFGAFVTVRQGGIPPWRSAMPLKLQAVIRTVCAREQGISQTETTRRPGVGCGWK
jgi:Zn-dependent protease